MICLTCEMRFNLSGISPASGKATALYNKRQALKMTLPNNLCLLVDQVVYLNSGDLEPIPISSSSLYMALISASDILALFLLLNT